MPAPATAVAIQGFEGSFHQTAARQFFGKQVAVLCCYSFRELIKKATDPLQTSAAVMAIENSIAGSILPNYQLLQSSDLKIVGEVYLPIKQQLLVNRGVQIQDIKEVHSHPMAILQCTEFLDQHNWKLVETEDTALSAKHIKQHKSKHIAAIVLPSANKASVTFTTDHSKGSLAKVLTNIADAGINLSKLQSFPIPGTDWLYSFHADMEFDSIKNFNKLIDSLLFNLPALKVYGIYPSGNLK